MSDKNLIFLEKRKKKSLKDQQFHDWITEEFLKDAEAIDAQIGGPEAENDYEEDPAAKEAMWNRIVQQLRAEGVYEEPEGDAGTAAAKGKIRAFTRNENVEFASDGFVVEETGRDTGTANAAWSAGSAKAVPDTENVEMAAAAEGTSAKADADGSGAARGSIRLDNNHTYSRRSARAAFAFKWVAIVAITLAGIFGVTLTSSANRHYWWEKVETIFGNGDSVANSDSEMDRIYTDASDQEAISEIESALNTEIPKLFWLPENVFDIEYEIYEEISSFLLVYSYGSDGEILALEGWGAEGDTSTVLNFDESNGMQILSYNGIDYTLYGVDEQTGKQFVNWQYGEYEYLLTTNLAQDEIEKILENIQY